MSSAMQTPERRRPSVRWLILGAAVAFVVLACAAAAVGFILRPGNMVLAILVTVVAISVEVLVWTAAGVFGWGFLAKRREALGRWRRRLFGDRSSDGGSGAP